MVEVINLRNYLTLVGVNHMTKHSKTLVNNFLGYSNSLYLNIKSNSNMFQNKYKEILIECNEETRKVIIDKKLTESEFYDIFKLTEKKAENKVKPKLIDIPFYMELNYYIYINKNKFERKEISTRSSNLNKITLNNNINSDLIESYCSILEKIKELKLTLNKLNHVDKLFKKDKLLEYYNETERQIYELNYFTTAVKQEEIIYYEAKYQRIKEKFFTIISKCEANDIKEILNKDKELNLFHMTFIQLREEYFLSKVVESIISNYLFSNDKTVNYSNNNIHDIIVFVGSYHINYLKTKLDKLLI